MCLQDISSPQPSCLFLLLKFQVKTYIRWPLNLSAPVIPLPPAPCLLLKKFPSQTWPCCLLRPLAPNSWQNMAEKITEPSLWLWTKVFGQFPSRFISLCSFPDYISRPFTFNCFSWLLSSSSHFSYFLYFFFISLSVSLSQSACLSIMTFPFLLFSWHPLLLFLFLDFLDSFFVFIHLLLTIYLLASSFPFLSAFVNHSCCLAFLYFSFILLWHIDSLSYVLLVCTSCPPLLFLSFVWHVYSLIYFSFVPLAFLYSPSSTTLSSLSFLFLLDSYS